MAQENLSPVHVDSAWSDLRWLIHGFSSRAAGVSTVYSRTGEGELNLGFTPGDSAANVERNRATLRETLRVPADMQLVTVRQVHSGIVHRIDEVGHSNATALDGDGLMTDRPGLLLGILTADCIPILVVDGKRRCVAAFHAGWRGTAARIAENGVMKMRSEYGCSTGDLMALIGPGIGTCCYATGKEVEAEFTDRFDYGAELFSDGEGGVRRLDLIEANRRQLQAAGVASEAIRRVGGCTQCHPGLYFSYRGEAGVTGRMMSVIGMGPRW